MRLEATASGSRLHYDYMAQVGGKVAAVGSRMLEGAARVVLAQLFESLGRQATGAALVALCFGLAGMQGAVWALWLGAGTATLAAAASTARLWAR